MTTLNDAGRLGELVLQSTLWLLLGLGLAVSLRGRGRLCRLVLTLALLGLLPLAALCLLPAPAWRLADLWPAPTAAPSQLLNPTTETTGILTSSPPAAASESMPWLLRLVSGSPLILRQRPNVAETTQESLGLATAAVGIALTLSGFFLLRLGAGWWALQRFRAQSAPIVDGGWQTMLMDLGRELKISQVPRLCEHSDVGAPATLGWWRPIVLLPPSWRCWSDQERRCVLAHELAHIAAGDFGLSCLAHLVRGVYAWQPLVHLLTSRLLVQLELLADAAAASAVGGKDAYARALCRLALRPASPNPQPPALAFWPVSHSLSWRMTMLTNRKLLDHAPRWPARLSLTLLLVAALGGVTGLRAPVFAQDRRNEVPALEKMSPQAQAVIRRQLGESVVQQPLEPYDTRFAQPGALGVMICRPAVLMSIASVKPHQALIEEQFSNAVMMVVGRGLPSLTLAKIDQAAFSAWGKVKTKSELGQVDSSIDMLRLIPGESWTRLLAADWPELKLEMHAGKPFLRATMLPELGKVLLGREGPAMGLVDERTLVIGDEARVKQILEGKHATFQPSWSSQAWQQLQECPAIMAVDLGEARRLVDASADGVQAELLRDFAPMWRQADGLLAGILPSDPVGLRLIAAAKPGNTLTMDGDFIDSLKRAWLALMSEALGPELKQVENLPGYRQSGAAGPGTRLLATEIMIEAHSARSLAEAIGPRQSPAPLPLPQGKEQVSFHLVVGEVDEVAAKSLELLFTPMRSPAGPHPVASLYSSKKVEFQRSLQQLRDAGHLMVITASQLRAKFGESARLEFRGRQNETGRISLHLPPLRPRHADLVNFDFEISVERPGKDAAGRPEKQEAKVTINCPFGEAYVTLLRQADGKSWWLIAVTPGLAADHPSGAAATASPSESRN